MICSFKQVEVKPSTATPVVSELFAYLSNSKLPAAMVSTSKEEVQRVVLVMHEYDALIPKGKEIELVTEPVA